MINDEIVRIFYEMADIFEIQGVEWKPRAYRTAARGIRDLKQDLRILYKKDALKEISGVGEHLSNKIIEYIKTGKISAYEKLKRSIPSGLRLLMDIPGMGPKKAKVLYEKLNIKSVNDLKQAIKQHKIEKLSGFGKQSEKNISENISLIKLQTKKRPYKKMLNIANKLVNEIKSSAQKIVIAGSLRRKEKMIGDIDIVAISNNPKKVMDKFTTVKDVKKVVVKGLKKIRNYLKRKYTSGYKSL